MSAARESVLWYCPDPVMGAAAQKVFLAQRVKIHPVSPDQFGQSVGHLLGVKGFPPTQEVPAPASPPPGESVLLLSGFTGARLDALLAALRRAGVPRISLKAVLTPTNIAWTFGALTEELVREHTALNG